MTSKERCLAALRGQPVDRTPVFPLLMHFSQRRLGVTYREFASQGQLMAEAQVKVAEQFGVDAITACSDAFRITADLGGEMVFPDEKPPYALRPLVATEADLRKLGRPDPSGSGTRMADRVLGTREMVKAVGSDHLVLGWVDMPFAEACSVCGVSEFMMMLYEAPLVAHQLLELLTGIVISFALAQVEAGAPMIGAGDAAASLVSPEFYREFALPYEQRVCAAITQAGALTKLHICGNTNALVPDMLTSGADLFNVDHLVPFEKACLLYGGAGKCFKGNLDPVSDILQATPEECSAAARKRIHAARGLPYMLSGGCEIPGETPDSVFMAFCSAPRV